MSNMQIDRRTFAAALGGVLPAALFPEGTDSTDAAVQKLAEAVVERIVSDPKLTDKVVQAVLDSPIGDPWAAAPLPPPTTSTYKITTSAGRIETFTIPAIGQ